MTTLLKNASYLKVSHSGQTTGSLLLADLADEENAKQEKKIPVYVPENGSITIPLDEDVLLSYQQGTIRGLEDQGFVTTTLLDKPSLKPELWVAPDGDDSNPGTREAPLATIQKAHDDLFDQFGHETPKKVILAKGQYNQSVVINTKNFTLTGTSEEVFGNARLFGDGTLPAVVCTNMTRTAVEEYVADGGATYTSDTATSTFTYTGASLARDLQDGLDGSNNDAMYITLNQLSIDGLQLLGSPGLASEPVGFQKIRLSGVQTNDPESYFKNCQNIDLDFFDFTDTVLDNCSRPRFWSLQEVSNSTSDTWRIRIDNTVDAATEGVPTNENFIDPFRKSPQTVFGQLFFFAGPGTTWAMWLDGSHPIRAFGTIELMNEMVMGDNGPSDGEGLSVYTPTFVMKDTSTAHLKELVCDSFTKSSTGSLKISQINCTGNVTLSDGTSNVIDGGVIEGNLTVDAPATADLTGVIVKGDLLGDGDITMTGGGYGGTNSLSGAFTYNALGTT